MCMCKQCVGFRSSAGLDPSIFDRNVSRYTTTRIDTHARRRRRRRRIYAYIRVHSCASVIHTYSACTW